jgi:hypothetical protein
VGVELVGPDAAATPVSILPATEGGLSGGVIYPGEPIAWSASLPALESATNPRWFFVSGYGGVRPTDAAELLSLFVKLHERQVQIVFDPGPWFAGRVGRQEMAGYLNPSQLHGLREPSGYSSGIKPWQDHCRKYYRLFDYSITGWLLDGKSGLNTRFLSLLGKKDIEHYTPFSGDGVGVGFYTTYLSRELIDNCPVLKRSVPDNPQPQHIINYSRGVHFAWYRTILKYPRDIKSLQEVCLAEENSHNRHFLDMYTFYYLMRYYFGGQNNYRAAWVDDTISPVVAPGQSYPITVTVRNDGWDTWSNASGYGLGYAIVPAGQELQNEDFTNAKTAVPDETTVESGQTVTFLLTMMTPQAHGDYHLYYDMYKEGTGWFRQQNNIEWKTELSIEPVK